MSNGERFIADGHFSTAPNGVRLEPEPTDRDLVTRLRAAWTPFDGKRELICNEAADRIEQLEAALAPFSGNRVDDARRDEWPAGGDWYVDITNGDLRRATKALAKP